MRDARFLTADNGGEVIVASGGGLDTGVKGHAESFPGG